LSNQYKQQRLEVSRNLRYLLLIFILTLIPPYPGGIAQGAPYYNELPCYLLMNLNTGDVLLAHNINLRHPPASVTKIMTAVLALENGNLNDMVTISRNATRIRGHRLLISEGEQIEFGKLLMATIVNSGNDGARAIAEHIGGSIEGFINMMNAKAAEIGMMETHFVNPSGMPDDDHYSCARDLALLTAYAMQYDLFRTAVSTKKIYFPKFGMREDVIFESTNRLLEDYPLCTGVKTGFTNAARYCLAASAKYKEHELIAIVLGAERNCQWPAAKELLEWGFTSLDPEYPIYAEFIDPDIS
jgi:D-alanyl-D-alanine carboxypeptidase (penicillin-binding protein 5/6)